MLRTDRKQFFRMEEEFYRRFPCYDGMQIAKEGDGSNPQLALRFHTVHGEDLPASSVSDGVMLSLAYIALSYLPRRPKIMLVEEPENGVHHASLKEIVTTLRDLCEAKGVQIIMTTHSPYLLDLVQPEEVRVFWKDEEGAVHAAKMSDLPDIEDMKKHFMTGEIWTTLKESDIVEKVRGEK